MKIFNLKPFFLIFPLLLSACGSGSQESDGQTEGEAQIAEFREQFDSLNETVLARIQTLEDSLKQVAADQRRAVEREITYLREIHEEITTRRDNLKVEYRQNQRFFRQNMQKSLVEIESRLKRTQQR